MSENIAPHDTEELITTMIPEKMEKKLSFFRNPMKFLTKEYRHFKLYFSNPVQYFEEFKPRKNILTDFLSGTATLAIIAFAGILGSMSPVIREMFYRGWGETGEIDFWGRNSVYIYLALFVVWMPILILNLLYNERIKKEELIQKIQYSLTLFIKIAIPVLFCIFIWYTTVFMNEEILNVDTNFNPHTDKWEDTHRYFGWFMAGMWIPMLVYNLITNKNNKEVGFLRTIIYNLRLLFRTGLPMAICCTLWFIIQMADPLDWNVFNLAKFYMTTMLIFMIWQMIIFGSQIYGTSGNKKLAIIIPTLIYIGIIIALLIIANNHNDVDIEQPTIYALFLDWVQF